CTNAGIAAAGIDYW
nr:immunoglobulin heavy chain junction region [Macaca mulatta]MOV35912.1 immunoglobulin heavy chain junction region [Macaca mulatta]MOV35982.1 immunoglobulin heavy chain junction region [Macaca mulatta]MOV35999.1 immunoglobulin heavy chain junction region [Macaca mulatta]MOV36070.1 immunoglobulin heavy chain junction region [Macaca mulatta]